MKNLKSHFRFHKKERNGIFSLLLLIAVLQTAYIGFRWLHNDDEYINTENTIAMNIYIDSIANASAVLKSKPLFFNPNYIDDRKGYLLGMSVEEIDRLLKYRKEGKFVNSAKEFQKVTMVSDVLLDSISSYFKFPEWTQKKNKSITTNKGITNKVIKIDFTETPNAIKKDINTVTKEELIVFKGIGNVYANRILAYRNKLHGFSIDDQLYEIWGMEEALITRLLEAYTVGTSPEIDKLDINSVSLKELSKNPYLTYSMAKSILIYRSKKGIINSFDELSQIDSLSVKIVKRLPLYFYIKE
ncbi:hypothetical protein NBRC110019_11750 [Neptunitalea chrysea]|uniref:DNA uptake protein ComE n=1 Tax=Neptunitalea chrysea TaxID=1647581 RepID=A0A9W6B422_9FLAO|nr:helix-hairpin-helix domain-containing protein [Neptunitalea chrysea]GLB52136.1 hypothetical protein NBRC110019_11750 [Neptunitalea chrysea]